jgi:hypothetical protein
VSLVDAETAPRLLRDGPAEGIASAVAGERAASENSVLTAEEQERFEERLRQRIEETIVKARAAERTAILRLLEGRVLGCPRVASITRAIGKRCAI